MNWLHLNQPCDRPTRRRDGRRPLIEDLEGRLLLAVVGAHIGTPAAAVQVVRYTPIQGAHIGMGVASSATAQVVQYSPAIIGSHII
jgi:hypothetical protein